MAVKKKTRAKRNGRSRSTVSRSATRTMNQFATAARSRVRSLQHEAEAAGSDASAWIGKKALFVRKTVKAQPVLMAGLASAVGVLGWIIGRRSA